MRTETKNEINQLLLLSAISVKYLNDSMISLGNYTEPCFLDDRNIQKEEIEESIETAKAIGDLIGRVRTLLTVTQTQYDIKETKPIL